MRRHSNRCHPPPAIGYERSKEPDHQRHQRSRRLRSRQCHRSRSDHDNHQPACGQRRQPRPNPHETGENEADCAEHLGDPDEVEEQARQIRCVLGHHCHRHHELHRASEQEREREQSLNDPQRNTSRSDRRHCSVSSHASSGGRTELTGWNLLSTDTSNQTPGNRHAPRLNLYRGASNELRDRGSWASIHQRRACESTWARRRSSCSLSSGVNSAPKSSASKTWRISISDSVPGNGFGARFTHSIASSFDFT